MLSLCSGSATMAEAALNMGRSCISVDIDGRSDYFTLFFFKDYQFSKSTRRIKDIYDGMMVEVSKPGNDYAK